MLPALFTHLARSSRRLARTSTIDLVVPVVADMYGVSRGDLYVRHSGARGYGPEGLARRVTMYALVTYGGMSRYEVAEHFGCDVAHVSRVVRDITTRRDDDLLFDRQLDDVELGILDLKEELAA